jgi:hypothetical protein
MELDHAHASGRLAQRPATGSTATLRVATDADRPENAFHGQIVYTEDAGNAYIWDAAALSGDGEWQPFGGGSEFYAQPDPPPTAGYGAFWLDTAP